MATNEELQKAATRLLRDTALGRAKCDAVRRFRTVCVLQKGGAHASEYRVHDLTNVGSDLPRQCPDGWISTCLWIRSQVAYGFRGTSWILQSSRLLPRPQVFSAPRVCA